MQISSGSQDILKGWMIMSKKHNYSRIINKIGEDIISSDRFQDARQITHHGTENVAEHSLRVAEQACEIALLLKKHGVDVDLTDVIRGSLLHDIGMTDRDVNEAPAPSKAYKHPEHGARIASAEFHANEVQEQAVKRHMWPINVIPPTHTAGWVIIAADKIVSMKEVM